MVAQGIHRVRVDEDALRGEAAGHDLVVHNRSRGKVDAFVAEGGTAIAGWLYVCPPG